MKSGSLILLLLLAPLARLSSAAADYLHVDFQSGIPATFVVEDRDEVPVEVACYKNVPTTEAWTTERVGRHGRAALSLTHSLSDVAQENWLISPEVSVTSAEACIRWEARSVLPGFLESYKIMVRPSDEAGFTELLDVPEEQATWITRTVSLAGYVGRDVRIAVVCTSVNKYMLAIDNLAVGVMTDDAFEVESRTEHFCGDVGSIAVCGSVTNVGKAQSFVRLVCVVDDEDVSGQVADGLATGQSMSYSLEVPVSVGEVTAYDIYGEDAGGNRTLIYSDEVICSYFPRKVLVDKATGTWCNNCPEGELLLESLAARYGDEIIPLTTHTGDPMVQAEYFGMLGFTAIPTFMVNRNKETVSTSNAGFAGEILAETIVGLNATGTLLSDGSASIHAEMEFAADLDNSDDAYRLGYTIVRDYYEPDNMAYAQANSLNIYTAEQYYFLPSAIPPDLVIHRHVTVDCTAAFSGMAGSLPPLVLAGSKESYDWKVAFPSAITSPEQATVVVYVLNTVTGYVYNAAKVSLDEVVSNERICTASEPSDRIAIRPVDAGRCQLRFARPKGNYEMEVLAVDGRSLYRHSAVACPKVDVDLNGIHGLVVVRVCHDGQVASAKVILK